MNGHAMAVAGFQEKVGVSARAEQRLCCHLRIAYTTRAVDRSRSYLVVGRQLAERSEARGQSQLHPLACETTFTPRASVGAPA